MQTRTFFFLMGASSLTAVMRKHGKLMSFLRTFFSTRPPRNQLKQSGIVKERVFGCDLGEHLLNSGHDGEMMGLAVGGAEFFFFSDLNDFFFLFFLP